MFMEHNGGCAARDCRRLLLDVIPLLGVSLLWGSAFLFAFPPLRLMTTDHATRGCAQQPMVGRVMSCDATNESTLDAAFRVGGGRAQCNNDHAHEYD